MRAQQLARRAEARAARHHRVPSQIGSAVTVPRRRRAALTAPPSAPATASRRTSAAARLCTGAPSPAAPRRRPRLRRPARAPRFPRSQPGSGGRSPRCARTALPCARVRTRQRAWATARVCSSGASSAAPSLRSLQSGPARQHKHGRSRPTHRHAAACSATARPGKRARANDGPRRWRGAVQQGLGRALAVREHVRLAQRRIDE